MGYLVQRLGIRISRGWMVLILLVATLVGASYWIGPLRELPPELELLAVADNYALSEVTLQGVAKPDGGVRFALPLAVRNIGAQSGRPSHLALSVPSHLRVVTRRGDIEGEVSPGVPLRRYVVNIAVPPIAPGNASRRLPGLDTVWIEADLPAYYCTTQGSSVPEFIPAPQHDPRTLSVVRVFYSFELPDPRVRNTGTLVLHLNQEQLASAPAPMPPPFPTVFEEPEAVVPELGDLREAGKRTALCGDPERPLELFTVLWETANSGKFYVIYFDGAERKHLYDLDNNGIIELETWDGDGDGLFEARREARFAVPSFLKPIETLDESLLEPDTMPPTARFVALFDNASLGPWRFAHPPKPDTVQTALRDSTGALVDSTGPPIDTTRAAVDTTATPVATPNVPVTPPTRVFLRLFADTAAGPFRFSRPSAIAAADSAVRADSVARAAERPRAAAARPRRPQPLGTPVPTRPDTIEARQRI